MATPGLLDSFTIPAVLKSHPYSGSRSATLESFDVMIAPIDSVDPFLNARVVLDTPTFSKQTFTYTNTTIRTGMVLESEGKRYDIRGVSPFPDVGGYTFYQLMLEEVTPR